LSLESAVHVSLTAAFGAQLSPLVADGRVVPIATKGLILTNQRHNHSTTTSRRSAQREKKLSGYLNRLFFEMLR
jgi:hypothetical protein